MTVQQRATSRAAGTNGFWRRAAVWEAAAWLALCAAWIWAMALGDQNGFGYFHQPQNGLVAPLAVGGLINAALFWAHAFYAIPAFLAVGRWRGYLAVITGLFAANVLLQTVSQKLIILVGEPGLDGLGWAALAVENAYMPPFVLIVSAFYKFTRDWAVHLRERRGLQARASALDHALRETRKEIRTLSTAGASCGLLQFKAGKEKLQIPMTAVQYVKSAGNYMDVVTSERTFLAYGALKEIIEKLPKERFVRIHRSYVVGLDHIRAIKADAVHLENGELPIGPVYRKAFLEAWERRANSRARQPAASAD